jgi:hypothetical protein
MSFGFIVAGIILGGLSTLAFAILAIVAMAGSKQRNAITFGSIFLASLIIMILSISEMVTRISRKVRDGINNISETSREWKEEREEEKNAHRDWLKSLNSDNNKDSISESFYNSFDMEKNIYCIPLVYPYRIEMNDSFDDEGWLTDVTNGSSPAVKDLLSITDLAFDKKCLLLKRDLSVHRYAGGIVHSFRVRHGPNAYLSQPAEAVRRGCEDRLYW